MKHKIRILHLEDTPTDAHLVERELKKGNILFEKLLVDNRADFEKALQDFSPDIILSDHSLTSFDSTEALKILKEKGISIPFILITSTMTDEFAVNAMKEGAQDYVLKDRLQRLPSAIRNAIEKWRLEAEKQKYIEQITSNEKRFRALIEKGTDMITITAGDGKLMYCSPSIHKELGYTQEEYMLKTARQLIHPEDIESFEDGMKGILQTNGKSFHHHHRMLHKNGNWLWIENTVTNMLNEQGINAYVSNFRDISDKILAESSIRESNERYELATKATNDMIWDWDIVTNRIYRSENYQEQLGYIPSAENINDDSWIDNVHPEDKKRVIDSMFDKMSTAGSKVWETEYRFLKSNGELVYIRDKGHIIRDGNGKAIRMVGAMSDISSQKLAEIERANLVDELVQRNKDLEQFAYIISHNLRAPVANIIGIANAMKDSGLNPENKTILNNALHESVLKLDNVVTDLNDILQVKQEINELKEEVRFSKLVDDIKISIKNLIDKDDIEIKYDFSEIDVFLSIKSYLYSIFYNLITNSIKYRQQQVPCLIEIRSHMMRNKFELTFTDNGMGIDMERRGNQVFGLYKRFHMNVEGKGMGLFMVKTQVETLGGRINLKSEVNKGSEFKIEFER